MKTIESTQEGLFHFRLMRGGWYGYDVYGNGRLFSSASAVLKTARIQGVNRLTIDGKRLVRKTHIL